MPNQDHTTHSRAVRWVRTLLTASFLGILLVAAGVAGAAGSFGFLASWGTPGRGAGALNGPDNVAVDLRGDVYVADRDNNRVEKFTARGGFVAALGRNAGDGSAGVGNGEFDHPRGVATDGLGDLYVADSRNNRVEKFGSDGRFQARFGRNGGDGTAGTARGEFNDPRGLATDRAGNLYVADHGNNRVQKLDPSGRFLSIWGRNGGDTSAGVAPGEFNRPRGVAVDGVGDLYVADKGNNRIQEFGPGGLFIRMWGRNGGDGSKGMGNGEFNTPYSVAVDRNGRVYVADTFNNRVQSFTPDGVFLSRFGRDGGSGAAGNGVGEFRGPYSVATDCRNNLYVSDEGNNRIEKFGIADRPLASCPPALQLGPLPSRIPGRVFSLRASCDEPCTVTARAKLLSRGHTLGFVRALPRKLDAGRTTTLKLRLTAPAARLIHTLLQANQPSVLQLQVSATGFAGRSQIRRTHALRR